MVGAICELCIRKKEKLNMIDIENTPRPWGGGHHLSQTDMDDLEVRKVRALERIADALDGGKTAKYSGITIESKNKKKKKKSSAHSGISNLFDCFKFGD